MAMLLCCDWQGLSTLAQCRLSLVTGQCRQLLEQIDRRLSCIFAISLLGLLFFAGLPSGRFTHARHWRLGRAALGFTHPPFQKVFTIKVITGNVLGRQARIESRVLGLGAAIPYDVLKL